MTESTACKQLHRALRRWNVSLDVLKTALDAFSRTGSRVAWERALIVVGQRAEAYRTLLAEHIVQSDQGPVWRADYDTLHSWQKLIGLTPAIILKSRARLRAGRIIRLDFRSCNLSGKLPNLPLPERLEDLWLSDNTIGSIEQLVLPESLKVLELRRNLLGRLDTTDLPPRLEALDLAGSSVRTLDGVTLPPALRHLYIDSMFFESFGDCRLPDSLELLSLRDTRLQSLQEVRLSPALWKLDLRGSQVAMLRPQELPDSLIDLGIPWQSLPDDQIQAIRAARADLSLI